mgnify:CR=1 FL=1
MYKQLNKIRYKVARYAKDELKKWAVLSERAVDASNLLISYWKAAGYNFTAQQMQSQEFQAQWPWSAAFISFLFKKAGAGSKFPYSSAHATYFQKAKKDRYKDGAPLKGYRITEYPPKVGDLVVYSRQSGAGYDTSGFFPSHGEVVVERGKGYIKAIGGNVSNTVKISTYTTDEKGKLTRNERDFFMVIQNNVA